MQIIILFSKQLGRQPIACIPKKCADAQKMGMDIEIRSVP